MRGMEYGAPQSPAGATGAPDAPSWLPDAEVSIDPLPAGPLRRRRRGRVIAMVVCFVAALLSLAVVVGEWATQTAEADALLDQIERSEAAMLTAMDTVSAVLQEQDAYDGGLSDAAAEQLSAAAAGAKAEVFAAADAMRSISMQPWHRDVEEARQAYLTHSAVWQAFLSRAQLEPTSWFVDDPAIKSTWEAFAGELLDAIPSPDTGSLEDRARTIIEEDTGPADDSADTLSA